MSHTKYHTDTIVLGGVDTGEADRFIKMLTRDFGLIGVHARGIRKLSSKQRPYLQNLSFSRTSLVRGRNIWRLVHIEESLSPQISITNTAGRLFGARISKVLYRFIKGEEANPELFDAVKYGLLEFRNTNLSIDQNYALENLIVLRILFYLGYVAKQNEEKDFFNDPTSYDSGILQRALENRSSIDSQIYTAIEESGL